jgi:hypothetical protein
MTVKRRVGMHVAKEIDNHGLSTRTFDSVEAATTWALTGLTGSLIRKQA